MNNLDYAILDFIQKFLESDFMNKVMIFFTTIGNDGIIWIVICALLLIHPKTRYIGFIGLVALLFSLILNEQILKKIVNRDRPYLSRPDIVLKITAPTSPSFPSGHTASSFAAAFVFGKYFRSPYQVLTYILASLIAFSRMYLYVHFTTDVIAGILMGLLSSVLAIVLFDYYKRYQERRLLNRS